MNLLMSTKPSTSKRCLIVEVRMQLRELSELSRQFKYQIRVTGMVKDLSMDPNTLENGLCVRKLINGFQMVEVL